MVPKLTLVPPPSAWGTTPSPAPVSSSRIYLRAADGSFRRVGADEWKAFRRGARRLTPVVDGAVRIAVLPDPMAFAAVPWAGTFLVVPTSDDGSADQAFCQGVSDTGLPLANALAACEWTPTRLDRSALARLAAEVVGGAHDEKAARVQLGDLHDLRGEAARVLKRISAEHGEGSEFFRSCQELWRQREEDAYYSLLSADLENAATSLRRGIDALVHGDDAFKKDGLSLEEVVHLMAAC